MENSTLKKLNLSSNEDFQKTFGVSLKDIKDQYLFKDSIIHFLKYENNISKVIEMVKSKKDEKSFISLFADKDNAHLDNYEEIRNQTLEIISNHVFSKNNHPLSINKKISELVFNEKSKFCYETVHSEYLGDFETISLCSEIIFPDGSECISKLPNYYEKIESAWKIVDHLSQKRAQIRLSNKAQGNDFWWCYITTDEKTVVSQEMSPSAAICVAALDLFGNKNESK